MFKVGNLLLYPLVITLCSICKDETKYKQEECRVFKSDGLEN